MASRYRLPFFVAREAAMELMLVLACAGFLAFYVLARMLRSIVFSFARYPAFMLIIGALIIWAAYAHGAERWQTVEAANGGVYGFSEMSRGRDYSGHLSVEIVLCYPFEHGSCSPLNETGVVLICKDHYQMFDEAVAHYAPPKSVIGRIEALACGRG